MVGFLLSAVAIVFCCCFFVLFSVILFVFTFLLLHFLCFFVFVHVSYSLPFSILHFYSKCGLDQRELLTL